MGAGNVTFNLRSAINEDYNFLWRVASTTMRGYVEAIWGWDEAWQERRFRGNFGACSWRVIVVEGQDAGGLQAGGEPALEFSKGFAVGHGSEQGSALQLRALILAISSSAFTGLVM